MSRYRWTSAALGAIVAAVSMPATPANATPQRPTVRASQLPTVDEVALAFRYLAEGTREVQPAPPEGDADVPCTNWRTVLRAPTGRFSSYQMPGGEWPFFKGLDDPAVFTYRYASAKKARRAMSRLRSWLFACEGDHDGTGVRSTITPREAPRVGTQTLAMSQTTLSPNTLEPSGWSTHGGTEVVARSGRYVTFAWVQADGREPSLRRTVALARISLSSLS
jgi:hypothetical protein